MNDPQFRVADESDASRLLRFMREYYAFDGHAFDESRARTCYFVNGIEFVARGTRPFSLLGFAPVPRFSLPDYDIPRAR